MSTSETLTGFRLSAWQERIWRSASAAGAPEAYDARLAFELTGPLDVERLRQAFDDVCRRHDILRTTFRRPRSLELPLQIVEAVPCVQWTDSDAASAGPTLGWLTRETGRRAEGDPPLAVTLVAGTPATHELRLSLLSLCGDCGTLLSAAREAAAAYQSLDAPQDVPLTYAQFAAWQSSRPADPNAAAFWRRAAGACEWELPDVPRSSERSRTVCCRALDRRALSGDAAGRLAGDDGAVVAAAWVAFLNRLADRDLLGIGYLCETAIAASLSGALGPFASWIPLVGAVRPGITCEALARETAGALAQAREWVDDSAAAVHADANAAPPAALEYHRAAVRPAGGVRWTLLGHDSLTQRFGLRLSCVETDEGILKLTFSSDTGLLAPDDLSRLADRFSAWLGQVLRRPAAGLESLRFLLPDEERVLESLNATAVAASGELILSRFERQASLAAGREAVICGSDALTYGDLNESASRLAHRLRSMGVGRDHVVAVCGERSAELLIAIVGIWKAGGAYLPLDPAWPHDRAALVLHDARVRIIVTTAAFAGRMERHGLAIVTPSKGGADDAETVAPHPASVVDPSNLAYVLYTSGSTGRPKGVMVHHGAVANLGEALQARIYGAFDRPLRVSMNAPAFFDASVKQIVQLGYGHTIVVVPEEVRAAGDRLWDLVARERLDVIDCTPRQLRLMLDAAPSAHAGGPAVVLVGGEPIDPATWRAIRARRSTAFWNVYGPTECTVDATAAAAVEAETPAIGRPLRNVQVHALSRTLLPVPIGVTGELFISGAGVARGYLGQPALTAARFVPDPFATDRGARMYRTGDLGRLAADGRLEFVGRNDDQVKLRGYRIELAEIEAIAVEYPGVLDGVVIVRDEQLAAYVVPRQPERFDASEFKAFLRRRLPEYMVPAAVVALQRLPFTGRGKVDRDRLPDPQSRPAPAAEAAPPASLIEQQIAAIWRDVLQLEHVGRKQNFFDLGGQSIAMIEVHSKVQTLVGREVSILDLFQHPTVASLAAFLSGLEA